MPRYRYRWRGRGGRGGGGRGRDESGSSHDQGQHRDQRPRGRWRRRRRSSSSGWAFAVVLALVIGGGAMWLWFTCDIEPAALSGFSQNVSSTLMERSAPLSLSATPTGPPVKATVAVLPIYSQAATATPKPSNTPVPTMVVRPDRLHIKEKRYMLDQINAQREAGGLGPVVLGDNIAAQLHANASMENCSSSHWGSDGLKPYMRYSLAGGFQSNAENGSGLDYCYRAGAGYRAIASIQQEIDEAMDGWMGSAGHRRNILNPSHRKVNIGIVWDWYNTFMYQHFEGDYVEYDQPPAISDGILSLSGKTKNGVRFNKKRDLGIQLYYDPPPAPLTRGQMARTYCYDHGRQVASFREPLSGGQYWTTDEFTAIYNPCPNPYRVSDTAAAPRSPSEAHAAWQQAYNASQARQPLSITVPWVTAKQWAVNDNSFAVRADIRNILNLHGNGVYTIMVWAKSGKDLVVSEHSIFHGVTPPDAYHGALP